MAQCSSCCSSCSSSSVGLLFLLVAYTAAGPAAAPPHLPLRSGACQEHAGLHGRLDAVEKRVEDTVGNLESQLAALLQAIQAPQWRPPVDRAGRAAVDVLEDPEPRRGSLAR